MDGLNLLERAQAAGLSVRVEGDTLIIRGPRRSEPLARELLAHKAEILGCLRTRDTPDPKTQILLAWATELAELDLELPTPVEYVEVPLRRVMTTRVSRYAAEYLKTIVAARNHQQHPKLCWGQWTPGWWREREQEALGALAALRRAIEEQASHDQ